MIEECAIQKTKQKERLLVVIVAFRRGRIEHPLLTRTRQVVYALITFVSFFLILLTN